MVDLSSPPPLEPKVVFLYYIAIQKACIEEVDIASTSIQYIISREFLRKVKANQAARSFKYKYFIRAIASYNYIVAYNIVYSTVRYLYY